MKKFYNSKKILLAIFLLFVPILLWLLLTLPKTFHNQAKTTNEQFEEQLSSWFIEDVSNNPLNLHYTLANPENYGISSTNFQLGSTMDSSEYYEQRLTILNNFTSEELSKQNQLTKEILCFAYETDLEGENYTLLSEVLSPSLGVQAQLPILLAEYTFRKESDIQNYLRMLTSIYSYFENILAFEKEKAQYGTFMSDTTVERIVEQCESFICNPENNYLHSIFQDSIQQMHQLSDTQKKSYIALHNKLIQTQVIPAYQMLMDGLQQLKGSGQNENGLYYFANGIEYYEYLLKSNCGLEESVTQIQERLLEQLRQEIALSEEILTQNPEAWDEYLNAEDTSHSPQDILTFLEDKLTTDFPALEDVDYEIKYVHSDLEEYLSPAFYLTPPIDTLSPNSIFINRSSNLQGIDLFTTLAHEGFPGHLYQTIYFCSTNPTPLRHLLNFGGYVEGWATYIENYAFDYYDNNSDISALYRINQSMNLCILSYLDTKIHYEGWTLTETASYLNYFGITDSSIHQEVFQLIVETPSNYVKYYVGSLHFADLRDNVKNNLGSSFSLQEFHQKVLEVGPCPFSILEKEIALAFYPHE